MCKYTGCEYTDVQCIGMLYKYENIPMYNISMRYVYTILLWVL